MRIKAMLIDFQQHTEESNLTAIESASDVALAGQDGLETMLMLDADKTLAPQDTGAMFWQELLTHSDFSTDPLKTLFGSQVYSYSSFRQATLLTKRRRLTSIFSATRWRRKRKCTSK
jgi:hypothetical protein